jgi:hypothetical protein
MTWKEALQAVFSAKARHARRERNIATAVWDESPQLHEIVTAKEDRPRRVVQEPRRPRLDAGVR